MSTVRRSGHHQDVHQWAQEANLNKELILCLNSFVDSFPSLTYYSFVENIGIPKPSWLLEFRKVLAGIEFGKMVFFQFDHQFQKNDIWYYLQFTTSISSEFDQVFLENDQLIIIASRLDNITSIFALRMSESDQLVYEFDYHSLKICDDDPSIGVIDLKDTKIVFQHYCLFFQAISKIKIKTDNEEQIINKKI